MSTMYGLCFGRDTLDEGPFFLIINSQLLVLFHSYFELQDDFILRILFLFKLVVFCRLLLTKLVIFPSYTGVW